MHASQVASWGRRVFPFDHFQDHFPSYLNGFPKPNEFEVTNAGRSVLALPRALLLALPLAPPQGLCWPLAPPQSAPTWFQGTKLANPDGPNKGWMAVDKNSLQSRFYPNVFGVGDVTDAPTARTGAAIRKQAPVVVNNMLRLMEGKAADCKNYQGYSSCPLVVSHNKMLLAEFGYDGAKMSDPLLSTFLNVGKASYPMWLLKRHGLPFLYWNMMLKGKM